MHVLLARLLLPSALLLCPVLRAGLSRAEAETARAAAWSERQAALKQERTAEMEARAITLAGKTLRWREREFGAAPAGGRSLWISLHGGGGAPPAVNDQQWRNQAGLYQPAEGIYLAPRAPTDTWNLWHEAHIDPLLDRLIENHVALRGVNPDKVYVLGYSAGGDGVWQLAPRMADRWAAAAMMAGHPNEASLLGLRNLPFALFVGGDDAAYDRNKVVAARAEELDRLHAADPKGYVHFARVYPGLPHWMDRKDAEALPWMAGHTRRVWPDKVVWFQDDVTHTRFYWLGVPAEEAKAGRRIDAAVAGRVITLTGDVPRDATVFLSDELLDLDAPLEIRVNGASVFKGRVQRDAALLRAELAARADPRAAASARVILTW